MSLQSFLDWFAGGDMPYRTLFHCMRGDMFWIVTTVTLDLAVATGYMLIMSHWWRNERTLPDIPAKQVLRGMRNIFLLCGICGYLFIPVKLFWPAWRLYDIVMVFLVYSTWRYALQARNFKVVYGEIGRNKELSDNLEKSREESKRKSFFLNAISHDLRTPLNAIILQSHLAEVNQATNDQAALAATVRDMRSSAKATADLLNTLLEYAKLDFAAEPVHQDVFPLADLVTEVLQRQHTVAAARGLWLRSSVPTDLMIRCDLSKLDRVLTNLISNAIKFTNEGGIRVEIDARGANVELHVIDTGVGIDPAVIDTLFDEFVQLDNAERNHTKGFGLGLTIARRLACQWGGDISVTSGKGSGSRFTILLPNARVDAASLGLTVGETNLANQVTATVG